MDLKLVTKLRLLNLGFNEYENGKIFEHKSGLKYHPEEDKIKCPDGVEIFRPTNKMVERLIHKITCK